MPSFDTPNCPLCASENVSLHTRAKDEEYATTPDVFDYFHCPACHILFVYPMLGDQLGLIYPPNYYAFDNPGESLVQRVKRKLDLRIFRKLVARFPKDQPLNILDVGGGDGSLLDIFNHVDHKIGATWVVDLDDSAQEKARAKGHQFHLGPIEEFTYDGKFDVVLMLNLIEHVSHPRDVLRQTKMLLGKNGTILIKTPNFDALDARLFKNNHWGGLHTPRHFVLFTPESFTRLANETGLKVSWCKLTQGAPFWAVSILALAQKWGMIKIDYRKGMHKHWLYKPMTLMAAAFDMLRSPFSKTSQMFVILEHDD